MPGLRLPVPRPGPRRLLCVALPWLVVAAALAAVLVAAALIDPA